MTIDQMREKLKIALTEKRYNHSIGVMQTAVELAHHYGADVHKTAVAALLHDCAKNYSTAEMFELCERFNIKIDETSKASPGLIHGFLGAVIASKYYGVDDPEIYDAIYYHTIGKADMPLLTKIIYLADGIEPLRTYEGVKEIRLVSEKNIDKAVLMYTNATIRHVINRGFLLHPAAVETRNFYIQKQSRQKQTKD